MKKIACIVLLFISIVGHAQIEPFPGIVINQSQVTNIWPDDIENYGTITTDGQMILYNYGANKNTVSAAGINLTQGTTVSNVNGTTADIKLDTTYKLAWFYPATSSPAEVPKNEHLEVGIQLDSATEKHIENFVLSKHDSTLNPFDPDQLDVVATFSTWMNGQWIEQGKTYGFYFMPFTRGTSSWDSVNTDYHMRIRYTPTEVGLYRCQIKYALNGGNYTEVMPFHFTCVNSSLPGFMKVGANKRYFEVNGETFFPIGNNLPSPEGVNVLWGYKTNPPGYVNYLDALDEYKNSGANYFRVLMGPRSYGLEFEKLNNYSSRMNQAWELDQLIQKAKSLDLKLHLNMMFHYAFGYLHGYGARLWDWTRYDDPIYDIVPLCKNSNEDTSGYCYRTEQNKNNTRDFLTNPVLKNNYKKRIRYLYARWGYSTNIGTIQLISEFNGLWTPADNITSHQPPLPPGKTACTPEQIFETKYYENDLDTIPEKVGAWNLEMADYIKNTLGHTQHLLAACYGGEPNLDGGDLTYDSDLLDFVDYNLYKMSPEKWYHHVGAVHKYQSAYVDSGYNTDKPVFNSETGPGDNGYCDNSVSWIKNVLLNPFTGVAGALQWYNSSGDFMGQPNTNYRNNVLWPLFGNVKNFINGIDFDGEQFSSFKFVSSDNSYDMVYLRNASGTRYIGALHNRTWNFYTQSDQTDTTTQCYLDSLELLATPDIYENNITIESSQKGQAIIAGGCNSPYSVEFYDPFLGSIIGNTQVYSTPVVSGNYFFQQFNFPNLTAGTRPIVYFEATAQCPNSISENINNELHFDNVNKYLEHDTLLKHAYLNNMELEIKNQAVVTGDSLVYNKSSQLNLYPNPTSEKIVIDIDTKDKIQWTLHTTSGKRLDYGSYSGKRLIINMTLYSKGIYYLKIKSNTISEQFKIVKQ